MTTLKQSHDALLAALKEIAEVIEPENLTGFGSTSIQKRAQRVVKDLHKIVQAAEALNAQPDVCEHKLNKYKYHERGCDGKFKKVAYVDDAFCPGCGKPIRVLP